MDHDHWTMHDEPVARRRHPLIVLTVVAAVAATLTVVAATARDDPEMPLVVAARPLAEPSTTTTTVPAPTTSAPLVTPATPPPATMLESAASDELADGLGVGPEAALRDFSRAAGTAEVTPIVRKSSGTFALMTAAGRARLLQWDGLAWSERESIATPASVREVTTGDVTGDGTPDFVVRTGRGSAGVYNNSGGRWQWLPFAGPSGRREFVDGLRHTGGRLYSEVRDGAGRPRPAEWRWDGAAFTMR